MQKKLSNIIRKAAFFMIPIASAICYAGISDDVYASSETTEDSLIYNFRDAKKEGTITFVKRWKDGKNEEDRNIPNIEISTKKPRKNVSGYTVIFHGNGMTFHFHHQTAAHLPRFHETLPYIPVHSCSAFSCLS